MCKVVGNNCVHVYVCVCVCGWKCVIPGWFRTWPSNSSLVFSSALATLLYTVCPVNMCSLPVNTEIRKSNVPHDRNHHQSSSLFTFQNSSYPSPETKVEERDTFVLSRTTLCPHPTRLDQRHRCWTPKFQKPPCALWGLIFFFFLWVSFWVFFYEWIWAVLASSLCQLTTRLRRSTLSSQT